MNKNYQYVTNPEERGEYYLSFSQPHPHWSQRLDTRNFSFSGRFAGQQEQETDFGGTVQATIRSNVAGDLFKVHRKCL